jgi:hypothetical protein
MPGIRNFDFGGCNPPGNWYVPIPGTVQTHAADAAYCDCIGKTGSAKR